MINVALISYEFPPENAVGGIGSYTNHLSNLLVVRGFNVHVFSATLKIEHVGTIVRNRITNHLIYSLTKEAFRNEVLSTFNSVNSKVKFDIIESPEVGACGLEIKRKYPNIPLIVKLHTPGVLITKVNRAYQPLFHKIRFVLGSIRRGKFDLGYWSRIDKNKEVDVEYQICKLADKLTCPSKALKKFVVNYWGIRSNKIIIVPNPFTTSRTPINTVTEKIIVFVGKLTVLKGVIALTEAIPIILKKFPDYNFVLIGRDEHDLNLGGSVQAYMESKLKNYSNKIEFTGTISNEKVTEYLLKSEVAVFPSLWENFPTVILEAMQNNCALVASRAGGIPEIIEDNYNGILFDPYRYKAISNAIIKVVSNANLRETLAKNAKETILDKYGSDKMGELVESIYLETINKSVSYES